MVSIRGLWLLNRHGNVIFSRRFTTVECRAKPFEWYAPLPCDAVLSQLFIKEIISKRDDERPEHYPVTTLDNGRLWPFALVKRYDVYFLAIPSLDTHQSFPIPKHFSPELFIALPVITATFSLLEDLTDFVAPYAPRFESTQLAELHSWLAGVMPFGTPLDTDYANARHFQKVGFSASEVITQPRPAWRPVPFKGRQKIDIYIREEVRAVQYDSLSFKDTWEIFGCVNTRCDVENNYNTEGVVVGISLDNTQNIQHLATHECVQQQQQHTTAVADFAPIPSRVTFSPPLGLICLARYNAKTPKQPPIRGYYQMKEISPFKVRLLMQLKLDESITVPFDYCEVHFPFKNRGPISNMEVSPSAGSVAYGTQRKSLVWTLGRGFSNRNAEVKLEARVFFDESKTDDGSGALDPFFTQNNGYVQLFFKISNVCLSGLNIDTKSVQTQPATKATVTVTREFVSSEYIIWNSLGQVRGVANPPIAPSLSPAILVEAVEMGMGATGLVGEDGVGANDHGWVGT